MKIWVDRVQKRFVFIACCTLISQILAATMASIVAQHGFSGNLAQ